MAIPVNLEAVAELRAGEHRACPHYESCLTRAAYQPPGHVVPCAGCQGLPSDLEGLAIILNRFHACRLPVEIHGAADPEGRGNSGHFFSTAEMERVRQWLRDKDTEKIYVNKYLNIY